MVAVECRLAPDINVMITTQAIAADLQEVKQVYPFEQQRFVRKLLWRGIKCAVRRVETVMIFLRCPFAAAEDKR